MANIKSSAKRDLKSKELRAKNRAEKTALKTTMKKFDAAVGQGMRLVNWAWVFPSQSRVQRPII